MNRPKPKTLANIAPKRDYAAITIPKEAVDLAIRDDKEIIRVLNEKIRQEAELLARCPITETRQEGDKLLCAHNPSEGKVGGIYRALRKK